MTELVFDISSKLKQDMFFLVTHHGTKTKRRVNQLGSSLYRLHNNTCRRIFLLSSTFLQLRPENHLEFIAKTFMEKSGKHLHRAIVSHAPITEKIRKANETDWREILQISLKLWDDISKN